LKVENVTKCQERVVRHLLYVLILYFFSYTSHECNHPDISTYCIQRAPKYHNLRGRFFSDETFLAVCVRVSLYIVATIYVVIGSVIL
jgi:hypothetical protein